MNKQNIIFISMVLLFTACGSDSENQESQSTKHNWTRTNAGGGGALAMAGATASGTLLVASDLSGIYRSFDKGKSWDVLGENQGLFETHISALGFHTKDGQIFFAGTGDGLYQTKDGGEHFKKVLPNKENPYDVEYIESIVVSKSNPNRVYATQHLWSPVNPSNIYKSSDGGNHWEIVKGVGLKDKHIIKLLVHPLDENLIYALTGKSRWGCSPAKLYKSTDGGEHWSMVGDKKFQKLSVLDMDVNPTDREAIYTSSFEANECPSEVTEDYDYVVTESEQEGFYRVTDSKTQKLFDKTGIISVGIKNPNTITLVDILLPYDWNENAGTWKSKDAGKSWQHLGYVKDWDKGYTHNQYFAFGSSFNGLNKSVTKDIFNANNLYGTFGQWAWATFDGGEHLNNVSTKKVANGWRSTGMDNINGHALDVSDSNPNIVYMGGYDIGFWVSKNHGKSWNRSQPDFRKYPKYSWNIDDNPSTVAENLAKTGEGSNVVALLNDPAREAVVWASFGAEQYYNDGSDAKVGLFKSINYGKDWQLITKGLPTKRDKAIEFYGLSVDKQSPKERRVLYLTVKGDVYKSVDDGDSWKRVLVNGGLKFTEVDAFNSKIIYAGGRNGLWQSVDSGENWKEIGLKEMNSKGLVRRDIIPTYSDENLKAWNGVFSIKIDPNIKNRLYVTAYGKGKGLYRSDDRGKSWKKILTNDYMRSVAIVPNDSNKIYATSSEAYHSGGSNHSQGILFSIDAGDSWQDVNRGMAWNYGGKIEVESGKKPNVWVWSLGTGVQYSVVP